MLIDVIIFVGQLMHFCPLNLLSLLFSGLNNASAVRMPAAHMSSGAAGGGNENKVYFLLVGAACLGGGIYVSVYDTQCIKNDCGINYIDIKFISQNRSK